MNTSLRLRPLSRKAEPTWASFLYAWAVSTCLQSSEDARKMTEHAQLTDSPRGKLQVPTRVSCNFGTRQNLSAACRILMLSMSLGHHGVGHHRRDIHTG